VPENGAGIFITDKFPMFVPFVIITKVNMGSFCPYKYELDKFELQLFLMPTYAETREL
jgi:hypothetical protein